MIESSLSAPRSGLFVSLPAHLSPFFLLPGDPGGPGGPPAAHVPSLGSGSRGGAVSLLLQHLLLMLMQLHLLLLLLEQDVLLLLVLLDDRVVGLGGGWFGGLDQDGTAGLGGHGLDRGWHEAGRPAVGRGLGAEVEERLLDRAQGRGR